MSVVIAIIEDDTVYMAADTMVTMGDSKRHLRNESSQKVWKVEDTPNCIMGGAGYLRDINLIRHCTNELVPETNIMNNNITVSTIMLNTVPVIFDTIRSYNKIVELKETADPVPATEFMWAYKNKCFHIMPDGLVEEVDDYEAIGSGAEAALASLKHTHGENVYLRLWKALEAASEISLYVEPPYLVTDTVDCNLEELYFTEEEFEPDEDDKINEAPTDPDMCVKLIEDNK